MSYWWRMQKIGVCVLVFVGMLAPYQARAALSVEASFNVTETYTDNLFFEDKNKKQDFGTYFGPDLTLLFENPDIVIGATYFGRVQYFVKNSNQSRYAQNANIILDLPFLTRQYRGLTVTINENMNFTPQLDAFSFSEAQDTSTFAGANPALSGSGGTTGATGTEATSGTTGTTGIGGTGGIGVFGGTGGTQGVFTQRASAFSNRAGLTLDYAWNRRLNSTLAYDNQYTHFFSSGFQDSLTHMGTFSLPYRLTEYTTVTPSYSYRQTEFLGKSTQTTSADRTITHISQLGLSHNFSPSVSGTISGGVSFVKQEGATEEVPVAGGGTQEREIGDKFVGRFTGSATITKSFQRGNMSLSANQTIGSGGGLAAQATRTRTVTGQGNYELSYRMNAFVSAGWAQNKSLDGDAFDTDTYRVQTGLGYTFTQWLFGNLSYSRIDQRSNGTVATDVVVNQVFLSLTAVADPWFLIR